MNGLGKLFIAGVSLLALSACGTQLERAENATPEGAAFDVSLYNGYVELSKSEYGEGDYLDSDVFAISALNSGAGNRPAPAEITSRQEPEEKIGELTDARSRLVAVLDNPKAISDLPEDTATAQVMFDCWMQEQEENFQPDDIERCRAGFYDKIAALEEALKPKPMAAAPPPEPVTFVVYFDFDKANLDPAAQSVLAEAQAAAKKLGGSVSIAGHTDLAGPDMYNDSLSAMRADAVAKSLAAGGVSSQKISAKGYGKKQPAVATPDGTPEAANRRAVIIVQP
ncbi:MAG: OmpA family protein [Rhodospirillales bacterium]|nr:OmpA family protein [Rhodospirillales bacterium]